MSLSMMLIIGCAVWFGGSFVLQAIGPRRELDRFSSNPRSMLGDASQQFDSIVSAFVKPKTKKQTLAYQARGSEREMSKRLQEAGLETTSAQGKFLLFRLVSFLVAPAIGAISYLYFIPYYATILTIFTTAGGVLFPMIWLKLKTSRRVEDIQRELPLVLDLTNLGTSAGWDVAASFERVIDALFVEFPNHPLIKELKKARWLTLSGCTWEEGLNKVGNKLGDEAVKRTTLALSQAIKQGGDRSKQLESIATDAQRIYYSSLDRRLAALPVKALLVTMLLMVAYFVILLAPAAVQVKNVIMK